jgi:broad specificity phosphatase PhoE
VSQTNKSNRVGGLAKKVKMMIVDILRHGQKKGDELTRLGEDQIEASAKLLAAEPFQRLLFSGANRTFQAACIVQLVAKFEGKPEEDFGFNFVNLLDLGGGRDTLLAEIKEIQTSGDTVARALEVSAYARGCRKQLTSALLELAADMQIKGQNRAIVCSHSPYSELAVPNPQSFPYGINEACWVRVRDRERLDHLGRTAPLPRRRRPQLGARNSSLADRSSSANEQSPKNPKQEVQRHRFIPVALAF